MPNLPKPRIGRRSARSRALPDAAPPEREEARAEIVEAPGLRWINIERPRPADQAWLEERFEFHALDYEDVFSRNQRPKVDEYDDYMFIVLHFPRYDKAVARLNAAEVDIFVGPDYLITLPNENLQPISYLFDRVRASEELRESLFSKGAGYLLYKIVDDAVDASFPMLRKMGNKLERIEQDIFEDEQAEVVRDISNVKQEIINFRKVIRPQRAAFRDLERTKTRYIADDLDIYFDDIVDAAERIWDILENYKEVIDLPGRRRRICAVAPPESDSIRILTAFSVMVLPLTRIASVYGMNVHVPGEAGHDGLLRRARLHGRHPRRVAVVTPPAVSVKMPVVSASSRMPARISSSLTESTPPPVFWASSTA